MKTAQLTRLLLGTVTLLSLGLSGCQAVKDAGQNLLSQASSSTAATDEKAAGDVNTQNTQLSDLTFSAGAYPENYVVLNQNTVAYSTATQAYIAKIAGDKQTASLKAALPDGVKAAYSQLDQLGRTGVVTAVVRYQAVVNRSSRRQKRPAFPASTKPSGLYLNARYNPSTQSWTGGRSNNKIVQADGYRGYFYNKSHLLAYSLGGTMDTNNVVAGTRAQNVGTNQSKAPGGMAYPETRTRDWLAAHPNDAVSYQVTPIYRGDELVPRGTQVQVQSIQHSQDFHLNLYVFNNQPGFNLNYQTGTFSKAA